MTLIVARPEYPGLRRGSRLGEFDCLVRSSETEAGAGGFEERLVKPRARRGSNRRRGWRVGKDE